MGLGPVENWTLEIFTDVAHGNLNNKVDSTDSQVLLVRNEEGLCAPIMWQAHKLKRVVTSSIEAETLTLLEGCREAVYVYHIPSLHQCQGHHPHGQPQAEGRDEGDVLPVDQSKKELGN